MKFIIALFLVVLVSSSELSNYTFEQYVQEYSKSYSPLEHARRKIIFEFNLRNIIAHNQTPNVSYKKGINQFTDQQHHENQIVNGYKRGLNHFLKTLRNEETFKPTGVDLPASFDWRDAQPPVLTPVKSQGHCGSCWTFGAASGIEAHWAIATGRLEEFSEQQIASCTQNPLHCGGTGGCSGGTSQFAWQTIIDMGGLANEWTYPYLSYQGKNFECKFDAKLTPPAAKLSNFMNIETNSYQGLIEALATKGPLSVSVDASTWHSYSSGVFDGCDTENPVINHEVQLVGYGTDTQFGDYWVIRNSWGPKWGENGFIRLKRTGDNTYCGVDKDPQEGSGCEGGPPEVTVCGMCGILFDNAFPIVDVANQNIVQQD